MDEKVTISGVPIEFEPEFRSPATDSSEELVYGVKRSVKRSVVELANRRMEAEGIEWRFVEVRNSGGVSVYELQRTVG